MQSLILTRIAFLAILCPLVCMAGGGAEESDMFENRTPESPLRRSSSTSSLKETSSRNACESDFEIISKEEVERIQEAESALWGVKNLFGAVTNGMQKFLDYAYTSADQSEYTPRTSEEEERERERCRRLRKERQAEESRQEFLRKQQEELDEASRMIEEERTNPYATICWNVKRFSTVAATTEWDPEDDDLWAIFSAARRDELIRRGNALIDEKNEFLRSGINSLGNPVSSDDSGTPMISPVLTPLPPAPPPPPPPPLPAPGVLQVHSMSRPQLNQALQQPTPHSSSRVSGTMLDEIIKKGKELKKTEQQPTTKPTSTPTAMEAALNRVLKQRRQGVDGKDSSNDSEKPRPGVDEEDSSNDEWESD